MCEVLSTHNLFGLQLDPFTISIKEFRTVSPFLFLKVKTYITHNKYLTFLFFEDNYFISAKSAAEILSLNLA